MRVDANHDSGLTLEAKNKIIRLCKAIVPDARIILYGSRARGGYAKRSDIDLAIDAGRPLDIMELGELQEVLAATNLFYRFDVVDWQSIVSPTFKAEIERDGVIWSDL
jgi:predicted nucleotidyltransferase